MKKMVYVNKAGHMHKGSKPDGMSDEEYSKKMAKAGYSKMSMDAYEKMHAKKGEGHEHTSPDPHRKKDAPMNEGDDAARISKSEGDEVEETDLEKALNQLTSMVKSSDPADRKKELMQKSLDGAASDEEEAELLELMKGGSVEEDDEDTLAKSAMASLDPELNADLEQALDVSAYLKAHHGGTVDALTVLSTAIEKSDATNSSFQLHLAKALVQVGKSVAALQKSVDAWGEQVPAQGRAARSAPQARAIQKSFAGAPAEGEQLNKSQVLDTLEAMNRDSLQKGMNGTSASGQDLTQAIAKYESTGKMSRAVYADLQQFLQQRAA